MFEFLFKRATDTSAVTAGQEVSEQDAAASAARREQQAAYARSLAGQEQVAVDVILNSEFAGVRLAAAEHVHSQPLLEQVLQAMRNTDRRVAKLMQQRLDALRYQQTEHQRAQACLEQARKLLQDEKLTPNQVASLDRQWQVIGAVPELAQPFQETRAALAARLEAQVALQRNIIDAVAALRKDPDPEHTPEQAAAALAELQAAHDAYLSAPEHAALPRHLLQDYEVALQRRQAAVAALGEHQAAFAARSSALADWLAADHATLAVDELKRTWQSLPRLPQGELASKMQADFQSLLSLLQPAAAPSQERKAKGPGKADKAPPKEVDKKFIETMDALEAALGQGALHAAAEHDKWLKEHKSGRLTHAQGERLNQLRAELKRLNDWARWSGNVSREELIKAVEELPAQKQSMSELAKKVGSMRDRWKALDATSGHAPKALWERFDAACTTAYAPAAAHFKQLAEERHTNALKAQALIDETRAMAAAIGPDPDWKSIAAAGQRLRQVWSRLGAMDRKDKRKLDQAFDQAMNQLLAPLSERRKEEGGERERLIAEVGKINPSDRHALDQLRRLQEQWQAHAKALPLERKAEQALWQKFRAACDALFNQRKESAHAADHERKAHLHAREAICKEMESATFEGEDKARLAAIAKLLRDSAAAWHASGVVPRAAEERISKRYQAAVAGLQAQADAIKRRAGAAQANALRDKLRLAQALEQAIVAGEEIDGAAWEERWKALPPLAPDYERTLHGRFAAGLAGAAKDRAGYAATLERNRPKLLDEVLRLEIVAGVDSGAEFARDRLKMQVEVLQSSLKSGVKPLTQAAQYLQLCAMPALADVRTASRIEQLFRRIGATERG
ncbi:DUF349 domain-containing protein [Oxalobacteraceae bacterium A2-2]